MQLAQLEHTEAIYIYIFTSKPAILRISKLDQFRELALFRVPLVFYISFFLNNE